MLQAEVCEPSMALTLKLYGTVAVMSSVISHSRPLVGEHWLLGIQMWLMYRLSYSLAKEKKAQSHTAPFEADSKRVVTAFVLLCGSAEQASSPQLQILYLLPTPAITRIYSLGILA